jgi:Immunoglobulin-like domain of bacterial spore germination
MQNTAMMKFFLVILTLFFSILLACNSPKSGENTQSTAADTASLQDISTPHEATNTVDTPEENESSNMAVSDLIKVETPLPHAEVQSPLTIKGQARGTWYFEGEFQIQLKDKDDNLLARTPAIAQGPWMTEDFVPFEATLRFDPPGDAQGTLVLQKANPSDNPENDRSYTIPVIFQPN